MAEEGATQGVEHGSADVSFDDMEKMEQQRKDAGQAEGQQQAEAPEWLKNLEGLTDEQRAGLAKFPDAGAAMKSYLALQSKMGQSQQNTDEKQKTQIDEGKGKKVDVDLMKKVETNDADIDNLDVSAALEASGLDVGEVLAQWNEHSALTDEQYTAIKKQHPTIGKAMADTIAQGISARAEIHGNNMAEYAGGKDQLNKMVEWARINIPEAERTQMQGLLDSNKPWQMVIDTIKTRYQASTGGAADNTTVQSGTAQGGSGPMPFSSHAEYNEAFDSPQYQSDPNYRDAVAKRLAATPENVLINSMANITRG
ncbi:MAG: hypothetical protein JKX85_15885 [Phycisphaeraceae bacterium]|nr:hypothetical protein [Phycisphaeraceae bacterium]